METLEHHQEVCIYRVGQSKCTVVCMEDNTIINNIIGIDSVPCTHNCKPPFAALCTDIYIHIIYMLFYV